MQYAEILSVTGGFMTQDVPEHDLLKDEGIICITLRCPPNPRPYTLYIRRSQAERLAADINSRLTLSPLLNNELTLQRCQEQQIELDRDTREKFGII